jgi:hypothetical protein
VKKLLFLLIIFSFFYSCSTGTGDDDDGDDDQELDGNFWAHDFTTDKRYRIQADKIAEGTNCTVWAEKKSSTDAEIAQNIVNEFDSKIHQIMLDNFGFNFEQNSLTYNTLSYADYLGDKDGKLCILLLDIKDGSGRENSAYVAGYFWAGDLLQGQYSNNRDMVYINKIDNMDKIGTVYSTIVHELQHMMNYVTSDRVRSKKIMDTWIDEGLSSAAEWIYTGIHPENRWEWYNRSGYGRGESSLIEKGNNFFVWGNRTDEYVDAVLDDYATVYLFFQWLRLQFGISVYKDIIMSDYSDYRAVTNAVSLDNKYTDEWALLLRDWLAANYFNYHEGIYGYMDEPDLKAIKSHYLPEHLGSSYKLYPGEGVYSYVKVQMNVPPSSEDIVYIGMRMSNSEGIPNLYSYGSELYTNTENGLLSYNVNTNKNGIRKDDVIVTGSVPSASIKPSYNQISNNFSELFAISGTDMLKRNQVMHSLSTAP